MVRVSRSSDGTLGGVMIWLSLDDLAGLGLDPEADDVTYWVNDGRVKIWSESGDDG